MLNTLKSFYKVSFIRSFILHLVSTHVPDLKLGTGKMGLVPTIRKFTALDGKRASKAVITAQRGNGFAKRMPEIGK